MYTISIILYLLNLLADLADVCAFICVHSKIDVNFTSNMMSNGADAHNVHKSLATDFCTNLVQFSTQVLAWTIVTTAATTQNHPASGYVVPSNTLKKDEPITISS